MRKKTRSSAKVLRWKASGPPGGVSSRSSSEAMELVQQELPLKEGAAGLRVITIILAVMLLHVLFIGGIALYNLLGGGAKSAHSEGGSPKAGSATASSDSSRSPGKAGNEGSGAALPSSPSASFARQEGGKGQVDPSSLSNTEETGRRRGAKKKLRRVSTEEGGEGPAHSGPAAELRQGIGKNVPGVETTSLLPSQGEPGKLAPSAPNPVRTYRVARGDTLWRIARRFHVGLDDLMAANQLTPSSKLHIGQDLQIPAAKAGRRRRNVDAAGGE